MEAVFLVEEYLLFLSLVCSWCLDFAARGRKGHTMISFGHVETLYMDCSLSRGTVTTNYCCCFFLCRTSTETLSLSKPWSISSETMSSVETLFATPPMYILATLALVSFFADFIRVVFGLVLMIKSFSAGVQSLLLTGTDEKMLKEACFCCSCFLMTFGFCQHV